MKERIAVGRGVENVDLVLVDDLPEAVRLGEVRRALVNQAGAAIGQNAIGDVAVTGDPADICGAEVDVLGPNIEVVLRRHVATEQVAARGVENALGLAGAAAGVEDEKRMFAIKHLGLADGADGLDFLVQPEIATGSHGDFLLGALDNDDAFDLGCTKKGLVDILFDAERNAAAESTVRSDDHLRFAIVGAFLERFGAEAAEDDAVRGTDARAGQHRDDRLRNHRQINHDAIARFHAVLLQHVGHETDFAMKLLIGEGGDVAGLTLKNDGGFVARGAGQMAVEAIDAGVELAADEPFREGRFPEADLLPLLEPSQFLFGGVAPEFIRVFQRGFVQLLIFFEAVDSSALDEFGGRFENLSCLLQRIDIDVALGWSGGR